jgi:hypothetical protein
MLCKPRKLTSILCNSAAMCPLYLHVSLLLGNESIKKLPLSLGLEEYATRTFTSPE